MGDWSSTARRPAGSASTCRRELPSDGLRASRRRSPWWPSAAVASSPGGVRGPVRAHHRRPRAPGRYRPWLRVEADDAARATSRCGATQEHPLGMTRTTVRPPTANWTPGRRRALIDPLLGVARPTSGSRTGASSASGGRKRRRHRLGGHDDRAEHAPVMGWLIATPGAIDSHVHLITRNSSGPRSPPASRADHGRVRRAAGEHGRLYEAFEAIPVNLGLQASAR